ncbi:MAG TPA: TIR domain-containing protein [Aromatoleum sp.]|uniref:TIR domain-containing protein n=1 Tax=Aromatoleum sp. TaxID=2307007 RepID=UPI002B48295F|nr:TIR domain-containing protein [Aromatoleum sp.]HJV28636.1 TIR domain-containing protein [Aromatoleum sp.]
MSQSTHVFISYSHEDEAWCDALAKHLGSLQDPFGVSVWVDRHRIRAGRAWLPEIENALNAADLAILLISKDFLDSDFIRNTELPKLLARRQKGLPVIPILVMPCGWKTIGWLQSHEVRPRGDRSLAEFGGVNSVAVNRQFGDLMDEIAVILRECASSAAVVETVTANGTAKTASKDPHAETAAALLSDVLLQEVRECDRATFAAQIVERLGTFCGLSGEALLNAVCLFVEYQLLRSDEPSSPQALQATLDGLDDSETARRLAAELKRGAKTGDFASSLIDVNSLFFMLAREREALWECYFENRERLGQDALATLARIRVKLGFVAPQFLVAGLLSHFEDDWRPVLNAYQHSIPNPKIRSGTFESLQASQWNCWLVWGPSIPICRCAQWQGKFAYQYGYGDENNSLPLVELESDTVGRPLTLDPLVAGLGPQGRSAKLMQITGRLRWGPQFLGQERADDEELDQSRELDIVEELDRDDVEDDRQPRKYPMAEAQVSLWCGDGPGHAHHSDGLVLQLEQVDRDVDEPRVYFSAYLWMMFLVTVATPDPADPTVGPQLLRHKHYPPWPEKPAQRVRVRDARLWEELLPVFVHANIADPAALHFQRRTLVENALQMLRQLWERRDECFDPEDVAKGIRFHLVCSSDYSGCDCEVRYPSGEPLPGLLKARLAAETDRDFSAAVIVSDSTENPASRPWGLAGYYSSCHLPELVADYFNYIDEVQQQKARR